MTTLVEIKKASVSAIYSDDWKILSEVSLKLKKNNSLGLIGETGSGKTMIVKLILDLLPDGCLKTAGEVSYSFKNCESSIALLRGKEITSIFQDPAQSLNPLHKIGKQFSIILTKHLNHKGPQAKECATLWLNRVGLKNGSDVLGRYPHQLSGGQIQRVMIAIAMSLTPSVVLADEITTGLDTKVKKEVLDLIFSLQRKHKFSILFITHDISVVNRYCKSVAIMKNGKIIEKGKPSQVFKKPKTKYLRELIRTNSTFKKKTLKTSDKKKEELLRVERLVKSYHTSSEKRTILDDVSFKLYSKETIGIIGESGSGKSTLAKIILKIVKADSGFVKIKSDINQKDKRSTLGNPLGIVLQDSLGSLNPMHKIKDIISEPFQILGLYDKTTVKKKVTDIIKSVNLKPEILDRYPHTLSGGQRQRVSIARSLITDPRILILDEPTSALDMNVQSKIIDLLKTIQEEKGISYIFITHDIFAVQKISDRLIVLQGGRIVEEGITHEVIKKPKHRHTKELIKPVLKNIYLN